MIMRSADRGYVYQSRRWVGWMCVEHVMLKMGIGIRIMYLLCICFAFPLSCLSRWDVMARGIYGRTVKRWEMFEREEKGGG